MNAQGGGGSPSPSPATALRAAVLALQSGGPGAAEANAWLNRSASEWSAQEALHASLEVLDEFCTFCAAAAPEHQQQQHSESRRREEESVAFFAANLLLTRVRSQAVWTRLLSDAERQHVTAAAARAFSAAAGAGFSSVARRLGAALAAAAVLSGPEAAAAFSAQCLSALGPTTGGTPPDPSAAAIAWSALEALEQEVSALDAARRRALSPAVLAAVWDGMARAAADAVARALEALSGGAYSAEPSVLAQAAAAEASARAVAAWLRLEGGGADGLSAASAGGSSSRSRLTPAEFCGRHAALAEGLLRCVGGGGSTTATTLHEAAGRLEAAAADALALALGPSAAHPRPAAEGGAGATTPDARELQQRTHALQQQERAALAGALRALCASARPAALAPGPAGAATARAATLVAAAVAERDPELAAGCPRGGGSGAHAPSMMAETAASGLEAEVALAAATLVADVMLRRRERATAAAAADYLLALNETPVAGRAPGLGAPLFSAAVQALLKHTRLPKGFGGEEAGEDDDDEDEDDEDEFWQLRETVFAELAEASFGVVGPAAFFSAVAQGLRGGGGGGAGGGGANNDWRAAEGALYALKVVAAPARARANSSVSGGSDGPDVGAMLRQLFEEICGGGGGGGGGAGAAAGATTTIGTTPACAAVAAHPLAARQAAQALAAYAAWFGSAAADALAPPARRPSSPGQAGQGQAAARSLSPPAPSPPSAAHPQPPPPPPPPLEGALRLLLHALGFPAEAGGEAARAFRVLCSRCAETLAAAGPQAVAALADAASPRVAPPFDLSDPEALLSASSSSSAAHHQGGRGTTGGGAGGEGGGGGGGGGGSPGAPSRLLLSFDDRAAVSEGLARVAAALPSPEMVGDAALRLLRPHLARAEALVAAAGASAGHQQQQHEAACVASLADEVRLIGALMRAMDLPPSSFQQPQSQKQQQHPALRLLEGAWPLLLASARSPLASGGENGSAGGGGGGDLVAAAMAVFDSALQAARHRARPLLPALLSTSCDVFAATAHPAALRTLTVLLETFGAARGGGDDAAALATAQRAALERALSTAAEKVRWAPVGQGPPLTAAHLEGHADLARAVLAAGDAYLVFARELLLGSAPAEGAAAAAATLPCLSALCSWAVASLGLREREPVSAALSFWMHLLGLLPSKGLGGGADSSSGGGGVGGLAAAAAAAAAAARSDSDSGSCALAQASAQAALRCAESHGAPLVAALVRGLLVDANIPRALQRSAAGPLHALLSSPQLGAAAGGWLVSALRTALELSAARATGGAPPLQPADVERFAVLATRGTPAAVVTGADNAMKGGGEAEVVLVGVAAAADDDGSGAPRALPRRRFDALVSDFAALARGEGTSEALLAYEL
jgi:hypothetical protein